MFYIHLSNFLSHDCHCAGEEGGGPDASMVDNGEYGIFSIALQELGDEIHGYDLEGLYTWGR